MFGISAGMYSPFDKNLSKSQLTLTKIDFSPTRHSCKSPRQLSQHEFSQISQGSAVVNVSGLRLQLDLARIEERYPETIFADPDFNKFWDGHEYFLDRHRNSFEVIANWITNGGELVCPDTVPIDIFLYEISFYRLPVPVIEDFLRNEGLLMEKEEELKDLTTRMKIWTLFENPTSSTLAKVISTLSILAIVISTTLFCIETLPKLKETCDEGERCPTSILVMYSLESICVIWFIIELSLRLLCAPSWRVFIADIMNIIDFLAILPWLVRNVIGITNKSASHDSEVLIFIFRMLRVTRAFRVLKLSRYSRGLRILGETLRRSARVLSLLVMFQMVLAVTFASFVFHMDSEYRDQQNSIKSIPDGIWWAIITMCTVGYGDVVPHSLAGKISGAFCAMMGILCMSFPVPVFVSHFNYLYNQEKADYKFRPEDFMVVDGKKPDFEKFENIILPSILQAKTAASRSTGDTFDMNAGTRRKR